MQKKKKKKQSKNSKITPKKSAQGNLAFGAAVPYDIDSVVALEEAKCGKGYLGLEEEG